MTGKILYGLLLLTIFTNYGCKAPVKSAIPSLVETFGKDDTKPFGGYVAFHEFKQLLDDRFIETREDPFDESWKTIKELSSSSSHSLYLLLTHNLITSESEAVSLVDYVKEGNDLFVAADYIDDNFLSKIACTPERDTELVAEMAGLMNSAFVQSPGGILGITDKYSYYYYPFYNSFSGYDSLYTKVLGTNQLGKPNLLVHFLGKGRIYLSSAPRAFSNYFLLKENNYKYLENVFSYFRPDPRNIYWDEFYNKQDIRRKRSSGKNGHGNGNADGSSSDHFSSFNVINKNPSLKAAFWLSFLLLILYVLFNIKRKQRIIKEIKPNINTSLVFTETVGRLYLQKKNNRNIAEKMITYFFENIRSRYFMNTTRIDKEFISTLSRKSGYNYESTERLFNAIQMVQQEVEIDDVSLLSLNDQIQNFNKNKQ